MPKGSSAGVGQCLETRATGTAESLSLMLPFVESKDFEDAFVHGINPTAHCVGRGA